VRLHGDTELYASSYMPAALDRWAKRIAAWTKGGRDAYVYFDNDAKGHAPYDALNLGARFGYGASADEERPVRSRLAHAVRGSIRKAPHPMRARSPKLSV